MSENVMPKQLVEKNYIDDMLGVACQQPADKSKLEDRPVETNSAMAKTDFTEIIDENLYQLISVAGLKLAVQLSEISQAVDHIEITIENGRLIYQGESLNIVDVEQLIKSSDKPDDSKHYLIIKHRQLAIACKQVMDIQTIEKQMVCWRNENSQRQWLAGTIKQQGIAILDINALQKMQFSE